MTERENLEPTTTKLPQDYDSPTNSDNSTLRTQAAFVNKLYKMLEDFNIQHLICWSDRGDSFSVSNPTSFSKIVLPQYFKHNNWQSFVRQLNMYGFHKVNDMIHSNLNSDNQIWEFKHPHFKRGEIDDLQNIKRKSTKPNYNTSSRVQSDNDEEPMHKHILHIEDRLHHVSRSCELLQNETNSLRGLLTKQQQTIGEFATVLAQVLQEANVGVNENKRDSIMTKLNELQTLIQTNTDSPSPSSSTTSSPVITKNKRLGFGKESHLLNPEPSNRDAKSIDDKDRKKQRTE